MGVKKMAELMNQVRSLVLDPFGITIAIGAIVLAEVALYVYDRFFKHS